MNDADRHDQIEALTALKDLLDDENADADDIRDAAIRAVNRFDASIAAHGGYGPKRTGSGEPASSATRSTAVGYAGGSGAPSRRSRSPKRGRAMASQTPKTTGAKGHARAGARARGGSISAISGHGATSKRPQDRSKTRR